MNSAEAEACFGDGNYVEAARLLGKVTAAVPAFEEVVLRFVEVNSPQALQAFLQTKMDSLGPEDKAQVSKPPLPPRPYPAPSSFLCPIPTPPPPSSPPPPPPSAWARPLLLLVLTTASCLLLPKFWLASACPMPHVFCEATIRNNAVKILTVLRLAFKSLCFKNL